MLLFGTTDGGLVYEASGADLTYDPVQGERAENIAFWKLLDDAYAYMEDRDLVESFWEAMIDLGSGDLLQAYLQDATTSLSETPLLSSRRWVPFNLLRSLDFAHLEEEPAAATPGATYSSGDLAVTWQTAAEARPHLFELQVPVTERASLRWSYEVQFSAADRAGSLRLGYYETLTAGGSALYSGITRRIDDAVLQVRLYAGHRGTGGATVLEQSGGVLLPGVRYRIDNIFEAGSGTLACTATELRGLKYAASEGVTDGGTNELAAVNRVQVEGLDWVGIGIGVGDVVVYGGRETLVTAVAGSMLTTAAYIFPADAAALVFDVFGEVPAGGVVLDVPARTGDGAHTVGYFGSASYLTEDLVADLYPTQHTLAGGAVVTAWGQTLQGTTGAWAFFDPSSKFRILALPHLVNKVRNATTTWVGGADYHLAYPAEGTVLEFTSLPTDRVWAEHVAYDEHLLSEIYGRNIGLVGDSTPQYKRRLQGLYYAYFRGPARGAIRTGIHLLLGLPVAAEAGTVEELDVTYTGLLSRIRVAGTDYTFPRTVGTPLVIGDVVRAYQPLCYGVDIVDWTKDPHWFSRHAGVHELQKYHAFEVAAEVAVPDLDSLPLALAFLGKIRPTWKRWYVTAVSRHEDSVPVTDSLALKVLLSLWDVPCDVVIPRYDSYDYQAAVTDWRYDQVEGDAWAVTAGVQRHPQYPGVRDWLTDLSGTFVLTNGLTLAAGAGGGLTTQVGLAGPVVRKYVAVALLTSGSTGEVDATSLEFIDSTPNALDLLAAGARLSCGGQTRLVVAVDAGAGVVTLQQPFDFTGTGYPWEAVNDALLRGRVDTVTDDNDLDFASAFTGASGTYRLSLIDLAVMNAYYDWQDEKCPDEELVFIATLGAGHFGTTLLTGNGHSLAAADATVSGFTDATTEIGMTGTIVDLYLCDPAGRWYEIDDVTGASQVTLTTPAEEAFTSVPLYVSAKAYDGTFDFTNGSAAVPCTADMRGTIAAGDFIQAVPALGATPVVDNPPSEVLSVDPADGLTITLAAAYAGLTNVGTKVIYRGDATQFPQAQDLPTGRGPTDVVSQDFTDFFPFVGSSLSSTVVEVGA